MEAIAMVLLLISTEQLAENPGLGTVVDVRPLDAYTEAHLPGARHVDARQLSAERNGVPGMLKPVGELAAMLSRAGVRPAAPTIIYGDMDSPAAITGAARLFWVLEYLGFDDVAILDGGITKWRAEGRPVETGPPPAPDAPEMEFVPRPRGRLLASRNDVLAFLRQGDGVLVDTRVPEQYAGLSTRPFVKQAGHIPGARNVPLDTLFERNEAGDAAYYTMKTGDALREALAGTPGDPVITYCNTGHSSSVGYFAYRVAGFERIRMYDGSMAEWGNHPGLQVRGEGGGAQ